MLSVTTGTFGGRLFFFFFFFSSGLKVGLAGEKDSSFNETNCLQRSSVLQC